MYAEVILNKLPESNFVFTVRGTRAQISSWICKNGHKETLYNLAYDWQYSVNQINHLVSKYPKQCKKIKYEDLILNPEKEITYLCSFLGIDFDANMMNHSSYNTSYISMKQKNRLAIFESASIDAWKSANILNKKDFELINCILTDEMRREGYAFNFHRYSFISPITGVRRIKGMLSRVRRIRKLKEYIEIVSK